MSDYIFNTTWTYTCDIMFEFNWVQTSLLIYEYSQKTPHIVCDMNYCYSGYTEKDFLKGFGNKSFYCLS